MKPLATSASSPFAAGRTPNFKSAKHVQEADKHPPETGGNPCIQSRIPPIAQNRYPSVKTLLIEFARANGPEFLSSMTHGQRQLIHNYSSNF